MNVVPYFSGTVSGAFSNALGPSFGTICFGSFILTMVEMCKAAMERLRRQERGNILVCLLAACLEVGERGGGVGRRSRSTRFFSFSFFLKLELFARIKRRLTERGTHLVVYTVGHWFEMTGSKQRSEGGGGGCFICVYM